MFTDSTELKFSANKFLPSLVPRSRPDIAWLASWYNMFVSQTLKRSDQRGGLDTRDGIVQTRIFLDSGALSSSLSTKRIDPDSCKERNQRQHQPAGI